jgi:hypothetical protein
MEKWEYRRHAEKINYAQPNHGPEFFPSRWGAEGWEVVGYSVLANGYDTFEYILAKRRVS